MPPGVLRLMRISPVARPGVAPLPNQCDASDKKLLSLGIAPLRIYASAGATLPIRCRACGATIPIAVGAESMPPHARLA